MTLDEAKALAQCVLIGKSRGYVQDAVALSEFVMSLEPGKNIVTIEETGDIPTEPFNASPSIIPIVYDDEPESIIDDTGEYPIRKDDEDEL